MAIAMSAHDFLTAVSREESDQLTARDTEEDRRLAVLIAEVHAWLAEQQPWRQDAACRGEQWNYVDGRNLTVTAARVRVCTRCPVRMECLTDALRLSQAELRPGLVRGGLSADQLGDAASLVKRGVTAREAAEQVISGANVTPVE